MEASTSSFQFGSKKLHWHDHQMMTQNPRPTRIMFSETKSNVLFITKYTQEKSNTESWLF